MAAATAIGVAVGEVACETQCLSMGVICDTDPEMRLEIVGPDRMCVGDTSRLRLRSHMCGRDDDNSDVAAFSSSDPTVVAFDSPRVPIARALKVGRATITGNFHDGSGTPTTLVIEVVACADAGADAADESDAGDSD